MAPTLLLIATWALTHTVTQRFKFISIILTITIIINNIIIITGVMWAKEEATGEDEEMEPTLDAEGVGRLEQGAEEEKEGKIPISHQ